MFDHILIPVDGSPPATNAAETGLRLAVEHGAAIHGLYVVSPTHRLDDGIEQIIDALHDEGKREVSRLKEQAEAKGLRVKEEVTVGTPRKRIVEYAEANEIDLVVMGTKGRTGVKRFILGSVAENVVRVSEIPVLTIGPSQQHNESELTSRCLELL